jgi:hypothetical protein
VSSYEGALLLDLATARNALHASSYERAERALLLDHLEHCVRDLREAAQKTTARTLMLTFGKNLRRAPTPCDNYIQRANG